MCGDRHSSTIDTYSLLPRLATHACVALDACVALFVEGHNSTCHILRRTGPRSIRHCMSRGAEQREPATRRAGTASTKEVTCI